MSIYQGLPFDILYRRRFYHFVASMQLAKFCSSNDSEAKNHIVEGFSPSGSTRLFQKRIKKTPQGEKLRGVKSIQPKGVGVPLCTQKVLYAMGFTLLEVTRWSMSFGFLNVTMFEVGLTLKGTRSALTPHNKRFPSNRDAITSCKLLQARQKLFAIKRMHYFWIRQRSQWPR